MFEFVMIDTFIELTTHGITQSQILLVYNLKQKQHEI